MKTPIFLLLLCLIAIPCFAEETYEQYWSEPCWKPYTLCLDADVADSYLLKWSEPSYFTWDPKKDITTWELAKALEILLYADRMLDIAEAIEALPPEVKRHFERVD